MPNIDFLQFLPAEPTHWLTVSHYIILFLSLLMFNAAGNKADTGFLLVIAAMMAATAVHLYVDRVDLDVLVIFVVKTAVFVLPVVLAGLSPNGKARGLSVLAASLGFLILVSGLGLGCVMPDIVDARSVLLCQ